VSADRERALVADASPVIADSRFSGKTMTPFSPQILKIDRLKPIVADPSRSNVVPVRLSISDALHF